jgi:hypothetical protein
VGIFYEPIVQTIPHSTQWCDELLLDCIESVISKKAGSLLVLDFLGKENMYYKFPWEFSNASSMSFNLDSYEI